MIDVYNELVIDLVNNCGLNAFEARKVVASLDENGHIDYDALKEHYLDD